MIWFTVLFIKHGTLQTFHFFHVARRDLTKDRCAVRKPPRPDPGAPSLQGGALFPVGRGLGFIFLRGSNRTDTGGLKNSHKQRGQKEGQR